MDLDNPLRYVNGAPCRPAQIVCTDTILFLHTYWHKCMMKQVIYLSLQWMPTCKITKKIVWSTQISGAYKSDKTLRYIQDRSLLGQKLFQIIDGRGSNKGAIS
jgi:hypothetical protein